MGWQGWDGWEVALVLGGGTALGAYHLGACERLWGDGLRPDLVIGSSVGAVCGALLLGGPPEGALARLERFWDEAARPVGPWARFATRRGRRSEAAGLGALLRGLPGLTRPRLPGLLSLLPFVRDDRAMQDQGPLAETLDGLVDWDALAASPVPLLFPTVDFDTGEEVVWDSRRARLTARHLLAALALAPVFPPVELEGRRLCDGGLANILPVDLAFRDDGGRPVLCIAADLYTPGGGPPPSSLDGVTSRMVDLAFAAQARRTLGHLSRERALRRRADPHAPPAVLARLRFDAPPHESALRTLDFSADALDERRAQGRRDAGRLRAVLADAPRDAALAVVEVGGPA
jgi:NTE family protein